jgi:hypothetical protein
MNQTFKMNEAAYNQLLMIYDLMLVGRIQLAREKLEELLGVDQNIVA